MYLLTYLPTYRTSCYARGTFVCLKNLQAEQQASSLSESNNNNQQHPSPEIIMVNGGKGRNHHRRGREIGQVGVDEALLQRYHQPQSLGVPKQRDEEKRHVHRVREYWLEHEAMHYLETLLAMKTPLATFESHFHQYP